MAQIYQEVMAVRVSKLIADKEVETNPILTDELLGIIEESIVNALEEHNADPLVVEASKIDDE